jgi:crotonobetainyl-CoA:carnitine CoA-transferase CaiB-like acyl-CoA transferase
MPIQSSKAPAAGGNPASSRQQGIEELLRRLHTREFAAAHVQEAAEVIAQVQTREDSVRMAQKFLVSPISQVRVFAAHLLKTVEKPDLEPPARMGYQALAEVVKQWIREEAK